MTKLSRIRWQCRRGTRELDMLLENYLDHCYQDADSSEQQCFETLLAFEDDQLLGYFMGDQKPELQAIASLVHKISEFVAV